MELLKKSAKIKVAAGIHLIMLVGVLYILCSVLCGKCILLFLMPATTVGGAMVFLWWQFG